MEKSPNLCVAEAFQLRREVPAELEQQDWLPHVASNVHKLCDWSLSEESHIGWGFARGIHLRFH
eukprot:CAMPEP_0206428276 /NCGR_PEP_ID=MMETSP0324_2-20121206/5553_1 /ASSEMBLY_ACC=CAM_ASM_000836 /TAXON_ID=2866 /ORGANISM="Crypthecodinium cohnii, Strain Seligo" /LENGTH=63 /DNA_ID=CAMNT_0053893743 /DNA_START=977 /DNA_END=1168 /DNA_ORIENTATION=+